MNKKIFLAILIILFLFFIWPRRPDDLAVYFLDVGQGDAILLSHPSGINILIDGGPDNLLLYRLGQVLPWQERNIDYLIISHYHADHIVGLIELLNKYQIKNIITTAHQPDDFLYHIWQAKLQEKNLTPIIAEAGDVFQLADDLSAQVLLADFQHDDFNENSLVIKISYGQTNFLFTGDLGEVGEKKLLSSGFDLQSKILKIGHHGSRYSSAVEFLQFVNPELCLIQAGLNNKFKHPHLETLDRLAKIQCKVLSNIEQGTIAVFSNGFTYYF
ncbi:MAG: MBL fold metallo-hydrolase [Patescibacteria group bacterium]|nr:MBL fold metallo-hydrolase [Patescibacteria group bacterium]